MMDTMKTWFGPPSSSSSISGRQHKLAQPAHQLLRPSLRGTHSQRSTGGGKLCELRPVQELQDTDSAVTCVTFGQEKLYKDYCLLACASKDGNVVVYRCYRTEMELRLVNDSDYERVGRSPSTRPAGADHSNIAIHSRLHGHSRAVTSMFFSLLEDQLVTTSIDKSVRFWSVATGDMLKVFTDSSPALVAAFLPFNPAVFVASNSNAVLRLVSVQNGSVLQKLKVESEVRALRFDDTGLFCLAGTKNGAIHVLEATDASTIRFKFKTQLARGAVTCITFVPSTSPDVPPCVLVNSCDSNVTIIDCVYGPPSGVLTNLSVRHRVKVAHSLLPLRCCYSMFGGGWLVSSSEDKDVYAYSLARGANYKLINLKHHQAPVLAVAVNALDTLLVSADSFGRIVLWRRFDFGHLLPLSETTGSTV
eukprot:GHVS01085809.1.p1 GENE.GHVS01085809.1~~GHVS01085809.1.p1  ORF type:complete len:419 (+),score=71.88 GHVS01085809.1:2-1258(+)